MINVSNAFRKCLYEGHRDYLERVDIILENGRELNLSNEDLWQGGLSLEDAVSSDSSFDIGAAIINKCSVTINNIRDTFSPYDFTGAEVVVYVGLRLPDGTKEMIRKGTYTVDEAKYNGSIITLTCLDNMRKFDKVYSESTLIYPATLGQIVRDACSSDACDVVLQTYDFPHSDLVIKERPNEEATTFREVISWAAQIAGCFCRCDVYGRLELKWYDQEALEAPDLDGGRFDAGNPLVYETGDNADGGSFKPWNAGYEFDGGNFIDLRNVANIGQNYSIDISTDDVVITGVRVLEKTKLDEKDAIVTYQSGTDGYVISIQNNDLIKEGLGEQVAGWLGEQLIGLRFRRANISHPSDPTIEAGDVGFLSDRKGNTYRMVVSSTRFSTGGNQNTMSSAENPARNSADRFSSDTKNYVENRKNTKQEISSYDKTVQNMTKLISQGFGMYFTSEPQEDGSNKWFLHDKPTVKESSYVWQMTSNGLMVSTDGGTVWAVDRNGNALYNVITARGINADWINAGSISIKTKDKGETFYANTATGEVRINASSFSLSGKTIADIAEDTAEKTISDYDESLDQKEVFDRLTNNGEDQCIKIDPDTGKLYINGEFIQAKGLRVVNSGGKQTFYIDNNGDISINASSFSLSGKTIAEIAEEKSDEAVDSQSQSDIFNKLTNNGTDQCIKIDPDTGKLYINGEFIQARGLRVVNSGGKQTFYIDSNGNISIDTEKLAWKSTYSSMTEAGVLTCISGKIGGFTINDYKIFGTSGDKKTIVMQKGNSGASTAFAAGGSNHENYSDCPFRVSMGGKLFATGAEIKGNSTFEGELKGATGTFSGSLSAATGTFSGELKAATGTFKGSLSAATGTFAGSLSAATGTFSGSVTATTLNATGHIYLNGVQAGTRNIAVMATTGDKQVILEFKDGLYMGYRTIDL